MNNLTEYLRKSINLPGLYLKCFFLVIIIRVVITFLSYKVILKKISLLDGDDRNYRNPLLLSLVIRRVSAFVPKATCLSQALALRWLMARSNQSCLIKIGVMSDSKSGFQAHAWVEMNGQAIIGQDEENFHSYAVIAEL